MGDLPIEWVPGHHRLMPAVKTSNARALSAARGCSFGRVRAQPSVWHQISSFLFRFGCGFGFHLRLERIESAVPELVQPYPDCAEPGRIDHINAPCSFRAVMNEPRCPRDLEMLRHRGSPDRQVPGEVADRRRASRQLFEDRTAGRVGQGGKSVRNVSHGLPSQGLRSRQSLLVLAPRLRSRQGALRSSPKRRVTHR